MKPFSFAGTRLHSTVIAAAVALLASGLGTTVLGGQKPTPSTSGGDNSKENTVVVPYQKRPAPTYRVSLKNGQLFFLTRLEQTDTGYVLHTSEGEVIKVDKSEIDKIVKLTKDQ